MQRRNNMLSWILLLIYVLASSFGMILIKKGGTGSNIVISKENFHIQLSWILLLGLGFYVFSFLLWIFLLQMFNLTYISPMAYGITYICIIILSKLFLQESLYKEQLIGAVVIIGIFIINYKK